MDAKVHRQDGNAGPDVLVTKKMTCPDGVVDASKQSRDARDTSVVGRESFHSDFLFYAVCQAKLVGVILGSASLT